MSKKGDWVPLMREACPNRALPQPCELASFDPGFVLSFLLLDTADLDQKQDKLTIVRTVGEIRQRMMLTGVVSANGRYDIYMQSFETIYVSSLSDDDASFVGIDPRTLESLEDDRQIWRRTSGFTQQFIHVSGTTAEDTLGQANYSTRADEHVDIRVSRKLEKGEGLLYSFACVTQIRQNDALIDSISGLTIGCEMTGNLRGYVKF